MYECHITIAPVLAGPLREELEEVAARFQFTLAKLLMVREDGSEAPSTRGSFLTGHGEKLLSLRKHMITFIGWLNDTGYQVQRYKIECILIDSRYQDNPEHLLKGGSHASSY